MTRIWMNKINSSFIIHNSTLDCVYCANNPVMMVDPGGKETKNFLHLNKFGHASISVNETVYTYGRYGNTNNLKSFGTIGDGIFRKFKENEYVDAYTKKRR
jgi:hypothetical protein